MDKKKALLDTKITVNTFCNRSTQEDDADKNPAVQLYKLVMRAVQESNVFNVGEKTTLRKLLVGEGALISLLEAFAAGDAHASRSAAARPTARAFTRRFPFLPSENSRCWLTSKSTLTSRCSAETKTTGKSECTQHEICVYIRTQE